PMSADKGSKRLRQLPESNAILLIGIHRLIQAGKSQASGRIVLSENVPYTDEMLSVIFDQPLNIIRLALSTFEQFGMIDIEDGIINIANWEKHQNVDGLDRIREQTRKRVARHREKKLLESGNNKGNVTVTLRNATEEDIDIEEDIDKDIKTSRHKFETCDMQ